MRPPPALNFFVFRKGRELIEEVKERTCQWIQKRRINGEVNIWGVDKSILKV